MNHQPVILAVDDTSDSLAWLVEILTAEGYQVRPTDSGESALAAVTVHPPDLILLDLRMRGMDGLEMCRRLKQETQTRDIPVILMSAFADVQEWVAGLQLGAADYICKPFQPEELLNRVRTHLALGRANVSLRKQAAVLAESESRYRNLIMHSPDAVFVNENGKIALVNLACQKLFGARRAEDIIGQPAINFFHPDCHEQINTRLHRLTVLGESVPLAEEKVVRLDGSTVDVEVVAAPFASGGTNAIHVIVRDITERKQAETERRNLEDQLRLAQKMEAIGSLAGGVAHDFNNMLNIISGYAQMAKEKLDRSDSLYDDITEILAAADRAAKLTRQLLAFSRRQVLQPVVLNLNQIVSELEKMLRRVLGADIDLHQVLAPTLGAVRADPGQMEQVLMNLAVNARDAMPKGGKLTIETANVVLEDAQAARDLYAKPGAYVQLTVTDTGCGLDEETKNRLFEPFFTTKERGKGSGLGLSMVYGIVKQSGGSILVTSEPGKGTTFKIYLPQELSLEAPIAKHLPRMTSAQGNETILLVEDEEALRMLAKRILRESGYTVLTAANGVEALHTSEQHQGNIDLLLTDVVMPEMGGRVLAQNLVKMRPAIKVMFMSGYTDNAIANHGVLDAGTSFLGKPFSPDELECKVREALGGIPSKPRTEYLPAEAEDQPLALTTIRSLPREALEGLREAAVAARYDEMIEYVDEIGHADPVMADLLRQRVDCFDYDGVLDLLER
jgi:two-component system, cell cycle sensor histidine kinase and response regulator CckA